MTTNKKKSVPKKIKDAVVTPVVDAVEDVVEDVSEEINEEVGTVTFKKWHVGIGAVVITLFLLAIIL